MHLKVSRDIAFERVDLSSLLLCTYHVSESLMIIWLEQWVAKRALGHYLRFNRL